MVQWAHSKRSESLLERNYWAHSGTSIPPLHASLGPFKAVGDTFYWAPFANINTGCPCSGEPIQSRRKHFREETAGPIFKHRCWLCMLWRVHLKQSETSRKHSREEINGLIGKHR